MQQQDIDRMPKVPASTHRQAILECPASSDVRAATLAIKTILAGVSGALRVTGRSNLPAGLPTAFGRISRVFMS
jgi:hypothetical protein